MEDAFLGHIAFVGKETPTWGQHVNGTITPTHSPDLPIGQPSRKRPWLLIFGITLSVAWIAFVFNERVEDNERLAEAVAAEQEVELAKQLAYREVFKQFQERLSGEIDRWARDSCGSEARLTRNGAKRKLKLDESECIRQAVQDKRGAGYPGPSQYCLLVEKAGQGLMDDYSPPALIWLFEHADNATGDGLPCYVPTEHAFDFSQGPTGEYPISRYLPRALLPPVSLAAVLWVVAAVYLRVRRSRAANLFSLAKARPAFRLSTAALLVYEFWLGLWVFLSDDWRNSHDWPQNWLIPGIAVPISMLLSYLACRWAVAPNIKTPGAPDEPVTTPGEKLAPAQPDVALDSYWVRATVRASPPAAAPAATAIGGTGAPISPQKRSAGNYFARHWRGDLSLAVAYWINGFLSVAVPCALAAVVSQMEHSYSLRVLSLGNLAALVIAFVAWVWLVVGIWRSANRHVTRGGSPIWASLARIMVVLGAIAMAGRLYINVFPQAKELALIATGNDPIGELVVKASANGRSVIVIGTLREGAAAEIENILNAAPGAISLVLNSNGGRLYESQLLARTVRNRHLDTYVENQCTSACTYVFLAGRDRAATPNARIGFHQPSFAGVDIGTQKQITEDMMDIYRTAGLPESFVQRIGETLPEDMWYPTRKELIGAHVITRVSLGDEATTVGLDANSKQELFLVIRGTPIGKALEERTPGAVNEAVERAWAAKERSGSDAEIMNALRSVALEILPGLLKTADVSTLESFVKLMIKQMSAAQAISGEACAKLLDDKLDIAKTLPKEIVDEVQQFVLLVLVAAPGTTPIPPAPAQVKQAIVAATVKLPRQYAKVIADVPAYGNQPDLVCRAMIAFYRGIESLPRQERNIALRGLFQGSE